MASLFHEDFESYEIGERPDWEGFHDNTGVIEVNGEKFLNTQSGDRAVWIPDTNFDSPISIIMDFEMLPATWWDNVPIGIYFAHDPDRPEADGPIYYGAMMYGGIGGGREILSIVAGEVSWNSGFLKRESNLGFLDDAPNRLIEERKYWRMQIDYDGSSISVSLFDLLDDGVLMTDWPVTVAEGVESLSGGIGYHSHMGAFNINSITVIPEPSTLALLGLGGLLLLKRRSN